MDTIIVGIIIAAAVIFTFRRFVRIYKGDSSCDCDTGCSRSSKNECDKDLKMIQ
jgi:hypothetical protein